MSARREVGAYLKHYASGSSTYRGRASSFSLPRAVVVVSNDRPLATRCEGVYRERTFLHTRRNDESTRLEV